MQALATTQSVVTGANFEEALVSQLKFAAANVVSATHLRQL
jgi:hypothetical protein